MRSPKDINKRYLFFIGVFSMTQVNLIGWIGISELALFILAPFFCVQDWKILKKHGFSKIIWLSILMFFGAIVANWWNEILFFNAARGLATSYAIFATIVCLHHFLWRNIENMKWLLLGVAISGVVSTFVFQQGYGRSDGATGEILSGAAATENVMGYSLYWMAQMNTWASLPIQTAYLSIPSVYVYGASLYLIAYSLLSAGSRAGFGILLGSLALLWLGGKKQKRMQIVGRHFLLIVMLGVILIIVAKEGYKYAAKNGYMGDQQYQKFEHQTRRGDSVLALLMSGRGEFFIGLFSALDKPIIGHGSWAIDTKGYYRDYILNYGTQEDVEIYFKNIYGSRDGEAWIPVHSQMIGGWLWHGIFGLVFWLYVFYIYFITLKNNLWVIPPWYGYLCLGLPYAFWNILFSPFSSRISSLLTVVLCLFVKAVAERRMVIPQNMQREIAQKS